MVQLAIPKWKRMPLPEDIFASGESDASCVADIPQRIVVQRRFPQRLRMEKSLGNSFNIFVSQASKNNMTMTVKRSFEVQQAYYHYTVHKPCFAENIHIEAEAGSKAFIVIEYDQDDSVFTNHHQWIQINGRKGCDLHLMVIQKLSPKSRYFSQQVAYVEEGGNVKITTLSLGAALTALSVEEHLLGRRANGDMKLGYLLVGDQRSDYCNSMFHKAPQTTSNILAKGVLRDQCKKVYRGNLFFDPGSPQSVGREEEFATLLNPGVVANSLPALICREDDVIGEHAASASQLDQEQLFYIMSRGHSKKRAEQLIILSSFSEMMEDLSEDKRQSINDWISRRLQVERQISDF